MLDTEESFPKTIYEAINKCRGVIKDHMSTKAPSKELKFRDIMVDLFGSKRPDTVHFGYVYSRTMKQYFLFVDTRSDFYIQRIYSVMKLFLIIENKLLFLSEFNIILGSPVYFPPRDPTASTSMVPTDASTWYCFKHAVVVYSGIYGEGLTDEGPTVDGLTHYMDSSWKHHVMNSGIMTSD